MHSDMIIYAKKMSPDNDSKDKNPYNEMWMMTLCLRDFMYFDDFSRYINVNIFDRRSPRHLFQYFFHPCFSSLPDLDFKLKDNWESIFDSKAKTFKLSIYKNFIYYLIGVHLLLGIFFIYYNFGYGWILI